MHYYFTYYISHISKKKIIIHYTLSLILLFSLILTISRSGFTTLILYIAITIFFFRDLKILSKLNILNFIIFILLIIFLFIYYNLIPDSYLSKFRFIDESSMPRIDSFLAGINVFQEHPFFGHGYHFSSGSIELARGNWQTNLDSSLQIILIDFGIIGSLIWLLYFLLIVINTVRKLKGEIRIVYIKFVIYNLICILWASNFNNLVFYNFWLFPNLSLFYYFFLMRKNVD